MHTGRSYQPHEVRESDDLLRLAKAQDPQNDGQRAQQHPGHGLVEVVVHFLICTLYLAVLGGPGIFCNPL